MPATVRQQVRALAVAAALLAGDARAQTRIQVLAAGSEIATAVQIVPRSDGSLVVRGQTASVAIPWLVEIAPDGDLARSVRVYHDTGEPRIEEMRTTPDGGLLLVGTIRPRTGSNPVDALIVKLRADWSVEWQATHGQELGNEIAYGAEPVSDGGWLVHGNTGGGGMLMRLAPDGALAWQRSYPTTAGFRPSFIEMEPLGGDRYLVANRAQAATSVDDALLIGVVTADGVVESARLIDTPNQDTVEEVVVMPDGTAWISGRLNAPANAVEYASLIRLRSDQSVEWARGLRPGVGVLTVRTIVPAPAGGVVVAGSVNSPSELSQAAIVEVDDVGDPQWIAEFGGRLEDVIVDFDFGPGGPVACGFSLNMDVAGSPRRAWVLALDAVGMPPTSCGLDRVDTVTVADVPLVETPIVVGSSLSAWAMTWDAPVILLSAGLTSTIPCGVAGGVPPTEVSPPTRAAPLLVRGEGTLAWEDGAASNSDTFDVHRGLVSALRAGRDYGACWQSTLATTVTDAELPGPGDAWFYVVAGRNVDGLGPLGWDSLGEERVPPARCP